jgi:spore germination protein YaaH
MPGGGTNGTAADVGGGTTTSSGGATSGGTTAIGGTTESGGGTTTSSGGGTTTSSGGTTTSSGGTTTGGSGGTTTASGGTTTSSGGTTTASGGTTTASGGTTTAAAQHTRCGWIDGDDVSYASFVANASWFNAVHPKWLQVDPNGNVITLSTIDHAAMLAAAHANHVLVMPMIDNPDAARLRIIIGDAGKIAAHVQTLLQMVKQHGWDGIDLDYEHLWSASDRPGFTSFISQITQAFHAAGYQVSEALPATALPDSGASAYDYNALAANLDVLHFMHYDFHYPDGDHMGPIAPAGWVEASFQHAAATGHPEKFMLGFPNYAIGLGWYDWLSNGIADCTSAIVESTNEMLTCPYNSGGWSAGIAPHCSTASHGTIWFENLDSMDEKLKLAAKYGARGVTYWTIGSEIGGFFDLVKKYYP